MASVSTQTGACVVANEGAPQLTLIDDDVDLPFLATQARRIAQLRARGELTDVVLHVGGERFACHKLHLCAASSFFHALLSSPMRDGITGSITIGDIEPSDFALVLSYVYTGQCPLTARNVVGVLAAADRLAVVELRTSCTHFLQRHLAVENLVGAHAIASALSLTRLGELVVGVALEQFESLRAHESFVEASAELLEQLFGSDELRAREEAVVEALGAWLAHAPSERRASAESLALLVRLPLCGLAFLESAVEGTELGTLPPCRALLLEAYAHHGCAPAVQRLQASSEHNGNHSNNAHAARATGSREWLREWFETRLSGGRGADVVGLGLGWASRFKAIRSSAPQPADARRRRRIGASGGGAPSEPVGSKAHVRTIKAVCVDEEAGLLYTASWDHTAKKWGLRTGACLLTFAGHRQDVIGLHLCKAHGWLFTCADRVRCWDVHSGRCLRVYGASTFYCAASDCRSLYAAQYDGLILQFDLHGLGREGSAPAGGADGDAEGARGADGAAQAQAGAAAAAGGAASGGGGGGGSAGGGGGALGKEAGADELEEVRLAQRVLSGHESGVMGFALRADLLVSASIDSTAKAWSRASGECVRTFVGHTAQLRAVALWRETLLTGSYDQSVRQWSLESGAQLRAFRGHTDAIRAIVVGVDVHACFMWSASSDGSVRQWDLESGAQVQLLRAHDESVFALAHAEGVLYTGSSDCTAKRYDLSTGKCIMTFPPPRSADRDAGRPDRVPHVSL